MSPASKNSFGTRETLQVDGKGYEIFRLSVLEKKGVGHSGKLPFSLRVLLENLLRQEDDRFVHAKDIEALANWDPNAATQQEISFMPARVLLQDFTGVPCVVDLAAMREAVEAMDNSKTEPETFIEADLDFHLALAEAASNPLILSLIDSIVGVLREQRMGIFAVEGGPERGQYHHKRILEAVEHRDSSGSRDSMRAHLRQVREDSGRSPRGGSNFTKLNL